MENDANPIVEAELEKMWARNDEHLSIADQAIFDICAIGAQAKVLAADLRRMRRRLNRNTKRLCDALNAIKIV